MIVLAGLSAFPITPADTAGRVEIHLLRKLVARLVEAGVDSIGLLGSTGAYMYLERAERRRAIEAAVEETSGRTPLVVGIGHLRTDNTVHLAQDAKAAGASAGLLAAVSYTPLTVDEVYEHFETVARESGLPIVIYDNPFTTHFRFTPELVARLSRVPGIVAIKSIAGSPDETSAHLQLTRGAVPEGFSLGYSADANSTEAMIAGADTWYSVIGGLFPEICVEIVRAVQRGDAAEARRLNTQLDPVWDLFRQFSSMRVIYALTDILGIAHIEPPRPILPLDVDARRRIAEVVAHLPAGIAM